MFSKFAAIFTVALAVNAAPLNKRDTTCSWPTGDNLVYISGTSNDGWAMYDELCTAGKYCPYACPPGQLMYQWDTSSTSYSYPESLNGGLYCNDDGSVTKPYSDRDYCIDGEGTVVAKNSASSDVAFCQTVLPGDEAMLIPTQVGSDDSITLAVPGPDYWANTSAQYYINTPGVNISDACTWGSSDTAEGNWAPYVAGANMDSDGNTYVKIGWNPKYIDDFSGETPSFGLRITCDDDSDCDGLDCEIDPSSTGSNGVSGSSTGTLDGASYCIVTAKDKASANIEVFSTS